MINFQTNSASQTQDIAKEFAQHLAGGMVLVLDGPLGSGKTTFTQGLGRALGVSRAIKSPTFTIVKEYPLADYPFDLIHIDAYRLETGGADSIDLAYYLSPEHLVVIEWAEFLVDYLPATYLKLSFHLQTKLSQRQLELSMVGPEDPRYQALLASL
ncbi:tRNA (adenosine(37)-N6)-threonylcarbamoyltransferase complex ATPase subunit type 1 TsaE [Vaginisenegalia massiliensis]|uniref:tRNA (adenosine(37)-N6)-threonylcarbamoyltransferase complex ATPase subunit type 1 TsaE n=1 Tax=Vaginisenegalia massiliensis TaxID=2058294 RepID=UPI000F53BD7B|nr:tRNA (adenosine(37)-N6)-threonylcarbamoyltransferase complex ATPase subunit type 1 TsaE [Vaginisenegalia massiliensis]